ncbi:MAG: hypothetical protein JWQ87_142 [Candidatus Sulfotelmatobacter sp.]|nr:hypothetical protein [Candidatus Sulfotelmatobacter sp.]
MKSQETFLSKLICFLALLVVGITLPAIIAPLSESRILQFRE